MNGWKDLPTQLTQPKAALTGWGIAAGATTLLVGVTLWPHLAPQPDLVPITAFAEGRQTQVVEELNRHGIKARHENGQVLVAADARLEAVAALEAANLLANDTSAAFDQMLTAQSPWQTQAQSAQALTLARQKALAQVISRMQHVASADVMLAVPQETGFGKRFVRPSASVNVVMHRDKPLSRDMVRAIAGLVAGAQTELDPQDVVVIDANRGRPLTLAPDEAMDPDALLQWTQRVEDHYRQKIEKLLDYVPGIMVAVSVKAEPDQRVISEPALDASNPADNHPAASRATATASAMGAADYDARSNATLDIAAGSSPANTGVAAEPRDAMSANQAESAESERLPLMPAAQHRRLTDEAGITTRGSGYRVQQVFVSVNVPRSYFVGLMARDNGRQPEQVAQQNTNANSTHPEHLPVSQHTPISLQEDQLMAVVETQLGEIQQQVAALVDTAAPGQVRVAMVPDPAPLQASPRLNVAAHDNAQPLAATTTAGSPLGSWLKGILASLLGIVGLVMLFGFTRRGASSTAAPGARAINPDASTMEGDCSPRVAPGWLPRWGEVGRDTDAVESLLRKKPEVASSLINRWATELGIQGARQGAIILLSVDRALAQSTLQQLNEETVDRLTRELARIESVPQHDRLAALEAFEREAHWHAAAVREAKAPAQPANEPAAAKASPTIEVASPSSSPLPLWDRLTALPADAMSDLISQVGEATLLIALSAATSQQREAVLIRMDHADATVLQEALDHLDALPQPEVIRAQRELAVALRQHSHRPQPITT